MPRKSNKVDARPAFQFYPSDWIRDDNLAACSLAAQGLWMRMVCLMFTSPQRGRLVFQDAEGNVRPWDAARLARVAGGNVEEVETLLGELRREGVCSVEAGVIYNRRMLRDAEQAQATHELAKKRSAAGAKGGKARAQVARPEARTAPSPARTTEAPRPTPRPRVTGPVGVATRCESPPSSAQEESANPEELKAMFGALARGRAHKSPEASDKQTASNAQADALKSDSNGPANGKQNGYAG